MRRLLIAVLVCSAAFASVALAAQKNGITPKLPKKGATLAAGATATFKGRYKGGGQIWIRVSTSRKTNRFGVISPTRNTIQRRAKAKKGRFTLTVKPFAYPEFWLNAPGTYYWQAHRIPRVCKGPDCLVEGPIVKFKVG